jgi:translocation and assembly module TamB
VALSAELGRDRAALTLRAESGGGALALDLGGVPEDGGVRFRGGARLDRFPIVAAGQLRARANARLELAFEAGPTGARGRATLEDALVALPEAAGPNVQPLPRPDGIVVIRPDGSRDGARAAAEPEAPRDAAGERGGRTFALEVAAPRPVAVRGPGLSLEVEVVPGFRIVWREQLLVFGTLRVPTGTVDAAGAPLAVVGRTELRFDGPPSAPFVDLGTAHGDTAHGAGRREPMRVHARRPGGRAAPLGSAAGELQLYSLLASGEAEPAPAPPRPLAHSSVEGAGWGSALARFYASQVPLGTFLARGVPGRSQGVRTSVTGRVEIGSFTRLSADPERGENRQTVTFGVRLAPRLRLESRFGDGGTGALDVYWVPGAPTGRAR